MSRKKNNEALEAWDEVLTAINFMDAQMREVLIRDRYQTDRAKSPLLGNAKGLPGTAYADPTGEEASDLGSKRLPDPTHVDVAGLVVAVRNIRNTLKRLADLNNFDVKKRAARTKEVCLACHADVLVPHERIKAGFCETCYKRWSRQGRPDRGAFIAAELAKQNAAAAASVTPVISGTVI